MDNLSALKIDRSNTSSGKRSSKRRWLYIAIAVVAIAVVALWLRHSGEITVESTGVTAAYPYQGVTVLNATGYVVAQRKAAVASKATGRLEWLGVQEGSVVKAGEVIARLESADVAATSEQSAANVLAAKAELEDARVALERARDLAAKKFVSASVFDQAKSRFDKAQAAVAVAAATRKGTEVSVDQTRIRAPFDGVVLTKSANVGDIVTPFSSALDSKGAVVTMADMSTLEVEADVSESNLAKITVGQPCEIALDAFPDLRLRGEVSRLVPTVDRAKASVLTKIRFIDRDSRVLPEMSAKVAFLSQTLADDKRHPLAVVQGDAITQRDGKSVVFVIRDGVAHAVAVTPGQKINDDVELSGISAVKVDTKPGTKVDTKVDAKPEAAPKLTMTIGVGDRLVLKPTAQIEDGKRVSVAQK
jgi:RND family efflux transporter MFP subunit